MKTFRVLMCLLAVFMVGCGNQDLPSSGETTSSATGRTTATVTEPMISTARVVCTDNGTHVLTPEVEAQPDGVHLVIHNRTGVDSGYSVKLPNGSGMGDNAPAGKSEHIEPLPPGTIQIGCDKSLRNGNPEEPDYASLEIIDKSGVYEPVELECPSGEAVSSSGGLLSPDSEPGRDETPVEQTREFFSDQLKPGDTVELAGYPERKRHKTVRVVRDGTVLAVVEYPWGSGGSWYQDGYSACAEF